MLYPKKMYSTHSKSASDKRPWLLFRESREMDETDRVWVFCDGSSKGWFGAVVVQPGEWIRVVSGYERPTKTLNIAAELDGMLLGLMSAPGGSKISVVHDYLGLGAWLVGAWAGRKHVVIKRLQKIRKAIDGKAFESIEFIHHKGHQTDASDFTVYNNIADGLCSPPKRNDFWLWGTWPDKAKEMGVDIEMDHQEER